MPNLIEIALLADHPDTLPTLQAWFEAEWPAWYGPDGPGDAAEDLAAYAQRDALPIAVVARRGGTLVGIAVLRESDAASQLPLSPWAGAGLVIPTERRKGIGARLLAGLETVAHRLGFEAIYCSTHTADTLLIREGWELIDRLTHDGKPLTIYRKTAVISSQ